MFKITRYIILLLTISTVMALPAWAEKDVEGSKDLSINSSYFSAENADQLSDALQQSVQAQYDELDDSGSIIGQGRVDGAVISLPSGTYQVRMNDTHHHLVKVEIKPEQTSEVVVDI